MLYPEGKERKNAVKVIRKLINNVPLIFNYKDGLRDISNL